jgi:acetoacetyl-CoA synthetase
MHGRSDGILNVKGIRIGPAEIYRILERVPEVAAAMVVEQDKGAHRQESRLVLLVVLRAGFGLDAALRATIRRELVQQGSPAHAPSVMLEVPELPTTWSGKPSERSARDVLNGREAINAEALRNPASLEPLRAFVLADAGAAEPPAASASPEKTPRAIDTAEMISLWNDVLHQSALAPDSNFFDVGGDSLMALDLAMTVSTRVGHKVEMSAFFGAPTVAEFTSFVNKGVADASSLLVPLKDGGGTSPLYLVHGYGGSVMELHGLARTIDADVPIVGIRASGLEAGEPVFDQVEEMAALYLSHIRQAQPEGPYRLAGYSSGGLIAVEMARRLLAQGERVGPVMLLDTTTHQSHWSGRTWREFTARRTAHHLRRLFAGPRVGAGLLDAMGSLAGHVRSALFQSATQHETAPPAAFPEQIRKLRNAGLTAFTRYAPSRIRVPIVLVRSELRLSTLADPATIWVDLADGLEVIDISGDHLSMVRPPHLGELAAAVSNELKRPGRL